MKNPLRRATPAPVSTIGPRAAADLVEGGAVMLDVREDEEWAAGHAPGAVHVPLGAITSGQRPVQVPAGADVVVVCRSGRRSARAADLLASAGISVHDLDGGMEAWAGAGLPVQRDGGGPGTVV